jgi:regulator of cell morphogenesis and NO signaling
MDAQAWNPPTTADVPSTSCVTRSSSDTMLRSVVRCRAFATAFGELAELIEAHLAKEENLLFPALEALANAERMGRSRPPLPFVTVLHPIRLMEAEHVRIELALDRLRELVLAVSEPDTLSASWHQCMAELSHLDDDLREHHRTENEHLFPQALELERRIL